MSPPDAASVRRSHRSIVPLLSQAGRHRQAIQDWLTRMPMRRGVATRRAAIGLVCASHGVPFISIKDISNNELLRPTLSGTAMLTELGEQQVARRAAAFSLAVLRALTMPETSQRVAPESTRTRATGPFFTS
jgi:nucleoside phosphorylase